VNYLEGVDDKKFRDLLSDQFRVLVAGGFGNLKGKVFRIGSMGEVNKYHVVRTLSAIESAFQMMGIDVPPGSINKAIADL
jgi:aspartate aminotransferase-like enzyme